MNAVLLLRYVILTQTAPILVDLITALARQDLQAMEKLAKVSKIVKLINGFVQFSSVYFQL